MRPARHLPAIALAQARQAGREASAEADGRSGEAGGGILKSPNSPSNSGIITEISGFWKIPDHQQGINCKLSAAKSRLSKMPLAVRERRGATTEAYGAIRRKAYGPEGGAIEGNTALRLYSGP